MTAGMRLLWEAEGFAGMGDPCLRLWEASDLPFTPTKLNYKRTGRRARVSLMPLRLREVAETSRAQRTNVFVSVTEGVMVSFLAVYLCFADVAKRNPKTAHSLEEGAHL